MMRIEGICGGFRSAISRLLTRVSSERSMSIDSGCSLVILILSVWYVIFAQIPTVTEKSHKVLVIRFEQRRVCIDIFDQDSSLKRWMKKIAVS